VILSGDLTHGKCLMNNNSPYVGASSVETVRHVGPERESNGDQRHDECGDSHCNTVPEPGTAGRKIDGVSMRRSAHG
jgi:hypothetical protein